jgi:PKD domain
MPAWPSDWYPGGVDPTANGSACFTVTPAAPDVTSSATLNASCSTLASTYTWTVTGGSLLSSTSSSSTWTTPSTVGNYTVTLVVVDANSHTLSTSQTVQVGGAGSGGTATGTESDCGAWWHLGCWFVYALRFVFVPSNTSGLDSLWGDVKTKIPFSIAYDVVTFIPHTLSGVASSLASTSGTSCNVLGSGSLSAPNGTTTTLPTVTLCPDPTDSSSSTAPIGSNVVLLRDVAWWVFLIAFAFALYGLVRKVIA